MIASAWKQSKRKTSGKRSAELGYSYKASSTLWNVNVHSSILPIVNTFPWALATWTDKERCMTASPQCYRRFALKMWWQLWRAGDMRRVVVVGSVAGQLPAWKSTLCCHAADKSTSTIYVGQIDHRQYAAAGAMNAADRRWVEVTY